MTQNILKKVMKELKSLQDSVKRTEELYRQYEDIQILIDMAYEENDESMIKEIETELKQIESTYEELRIETLLSEEYDKDNAIVTLHAGAGGTEACDWVNMLYRMYNRWIESKGFTTEVLDYLDGDITGIKTVTFEVNGENAYGYLQSEKGVHSWCGFLRLIQQIKDRLRLPHVMWCRISKMTLILRLMKMN